MPKETEEQEPRFLTVEEVTRLNADGTKSRRETLRERLAKRSAARRAGADGTARDIRARFSQRFGDVDLGRKE